MSRRPIVAGCVVESAEGTRYRVSYYNNTNEIATLYTDDGRSETIELPISELKRIPDPRRKLPPVEGMPAVRPACANCGRPFKFWTNDTRTRDHIVTRRVFAHWKCYRALFCTLRCTLQFATAAHAAGYRIISKPTGGK